MGRPSKSTLQRRAAASSGLSKAHSTRRKEVSLPSVPATHTKSSIIYGPQKDDSEFSDEEGDCDWVESNEDELNGIPVESLEDLTTDLDIDIFKKMMEEDKEKREYVRYHRGQMQHRQTRWRKAKAFADFQKAAANNNKITSFFHPIDQEHTPSSDPNNASTSADDMETEKEKQEKAIKDLERLLNDKKKCPSGQDKTRHQLVLAFLYFRQNRPWATRNQCALDAATGVNKGTFVARKIIQWEKSWKATRTIPVGQQGLHRKFASWLNDEGVEIACREYISQNKDKVTAHGLAKAVGTYLQDQEAEGLLDGVISALEVEGNGRHLKTRTIGAKTARNWLRRLGYSWKHVRKGIYIDGHERDDVKDYRDNYFIPTVQSLLPRMVNWTLDEDGLKQHEPTTTSEQRPLIYVTHDESIFNANDGKRQMWIQTESQPLRQKSKGQGIMVSEFLTPIGRLRVPDKPFEQFTFEEQNLMTAYNLKPGQYATIILEYGKDNYWDGDKMIEQITKLAIPIFSLAFPKHQAIFFFDNASNHAAFASDALNAYRMNLGPGGKQPKMRDGWFGNPSIPQSMQFPDNYHKTEDRGQPKGIRQVLVERNLWRTGLLKECKPKCSKTQPDCCAQHLLSCQPDFISQTGRIQEVIEEHGHCIMFYPKFHCELNFIEYFWAAAKRYARENCEYTLKGLRKVAPFSIESVPAVTIWKYHQKCLRIMRVYHDGIQYGSPEYVQQVYKSHRRVTKIVDD